jgi:hypothetical protein
MAVLVAVGGDSLDEQLDKVAAPLEGFYRVALYFREVVSECAQPCLRLLGSKAVVLAGCDVGLDGGD